MKHMDVNPLRNNAMTKRLIFSAFQTSMRGFMLFRQCLLSSVEMVIWLLAYEPYQKTFICFWLLFIKNSFLFHALSPI